MSSGRFVCCSLAGRRKKPVPANGPAREMQFAYLVAEAAFVSEAALAGSRPAQMKSTHSRIARCAASPWRWPSFHDACVAAVRSLKRRRQFLKKDAHDVFAFAPRLAFDLAPVQCAGLMTQARCRKAAGVNCAGLGPG